MNPSHLTKKEAALLSAHHPEIFSISEHCRIYCSESLSILSFDDSPGSQSPPFLHSHEAYEFLIPYGPLPLIMYENDIYFGDVGFVYPVHSGVAHGSKFNVSGTPHDNVVIDRDFLDEILRSKGMPDKKFDLRFELTDEIRSYLQFFKDEYAKAGTFEKNGNGHSNSTAPEYDKNANMSVKQTNDFSVNATGKQANELSRAGNLQGNEKLRALSTLLVHEFIENEFLLKHQRPKRQQEYQKGIMQIAAYMNRHFTEPLSIEILADMCKLSKPYFISVFKKVMGETPYSYLNLLRIAKAKILLETGGYSVREISAMCGFAKSNTFTSLFKNNTGMTPTRYRSKLKHDVRFL